ncbi:hypothetical protein SAMN05216353_102119 [Halobacillus alkaliphilus]|uniref:Uncharacterized protein n=1 Tax=Halobacillus alkaliphilus TaxID=396056 RepID=A0A1I2JYA2_9BACI|nr:hypothetical protein SAMN05216353_102119 [Halobacillus alkaliphilus]
MKYSFHVFISFRGISFNGYIVKVDNLRGSKAFAIGNKLLPPPPIIQHNFISLMMDAL